ncbi:hypothetical protein [Mesorhizobium sp. M0037]|uniref:hypothetical protein n=2 Tax=unclassified Mesorhizobium TaxID=325217 RepID=UPI00333C4DF4
MDDTYQLAYFRFSQLDDERYVLTNQAGEYLVLPRAVLASFIRHELPSTHPAYESKAARAHHRCSIAQPVAIAR